MGRREDEVKLSLRKTGEKVLRIEREKRERMDGENETEQEIVEGHTEGKEEEGEGRGRGKKRLGPTETGPGLGRGGPESALMTSSSEHSREEWRGAVLVCKMMLGGRERGAGERGGRKEGRERGWRGREIGDERGRDGGMMGSPRALCDLVFRANLVSGMGSEGA